MNVPQGNEPPRPPRRPRYAGSYPRRFSQKYKELQGDPATLARVAASGKTPAGTHRPIMTAEVLAALAIGPGDTVADATLGFGGHTAEFLAAGATVHAFDVDPLEGPRTIARLRAAGHQEDRLIFHQGNFAGMARTLAAAGLSDGADAVFADLGLSSMQIDNPQRGFTWKDDGPLDMRLNPAHGIPASRFLASSTPEKLARILSANADEPMADALAAALAGKSFPSTTALASAIRALATPALRLRPAADEEIQRTIRRVFQAIRIEVNGEFSALEALLRSLPACLRPGGRAAFLSFHSGEDRRVKHTFTQLAAAGQFSLPHDDQPLRASPAEQRANPRSSSARLRWITRLA